MVYQPINCPWCGAPSEQRQAINTCEICNNQFSVSPPNRIEKVQQDYSKELLEKLVDKINTKEVV